MGAKTDLGFLDTLSPKKEHLTWLFNTIWILSLLNTFATFVCVF